MLRLDLGGQPYGKAEHNRTLRESLDARTKGSVEFKHRNISAVLLKMGLPYIDGYRPARNYQRTVLPQVIRTYLESHPEFHKQLASSPVLNPMSPVPVEGAEVGRYFDDPPEHMVVPQGDEKPWLSRRGRKVDYARRDALNRHLGRLGEQFAVEVERRRLLEAGRDSLAARVGKPFRSRSSPRAAQPSSAFCTKVWIFPYPICPGRNSPYVKNGRLRSSGRSMNYSRGNVRSLCLIPATEAPLAQLEEHEGFHSVPPIQWQVPSRHTASTTLECRPSSPSCQRGQL